MYCDHSKELRDIPLRPPYYTVQGFIRYYTYCILIAKGYTYGVSCSRYGAVFEGFGYGRFVGENLQSEPVCIHQAWFRLGDLEEECLYCHEVRPRLEPIH